MAPLGKRPFPGIQLLTLHDQVYLQLDTTNRHSATHTADPSEEEIFTRNMSSNGGSPMVCCCSSTWHLHQLRKWSSETGNLNVPCIVSGKCQLLKNMDILKKRTFEQGSR